MSSAQRTPVRVLLVVLSLLALGALAPATAATLTKGAVKKIAVNVVAKRASSLSVAHAVSADRATSAASATDAQTVGGLSGPSLQTVVHEYVMPATSPAPSLTYSFPGLAPGRYLVSYTAVVTAAPAGGVSCDLKTNIASTTYLGHTATSGASTGPTCDNTTLITVGPGDVPTFTVIGLGALVNIATGAAPSSVIFTRVDQVTTANAS